MKVRRTDAGCDVTELARRARWGGLGGGVPPLTDAERARWDAYRRSQDDWVPLTALRFAWSNICETHGDGRWSLRAFRRCLDADRREIATVVIDHPAQRRQLDAWLLAMEAFARDRDGYVSFPMGASYHQRLLELGYRSDQD